MAQPVKVRASYRDDAAYLLRLEEAVLKDDRQSKEWREETCKMLRDTSLRLLQAKQGPVVTASNGAASSKTSSKRS